MLLNDKAFIEECAAILGGDTFSRLSSIIQDMFAEKLSAAKTEWEYKDNQTKIAGARDFISFLNQQVYDRYESLEEISDDKEPEFADTTLNTQE